MHRGSVVPVALLALLSTACEPASTRTGESAVDPAPTGAPDSGSGDASPADAATDAPDSGPLGADAASCAPPVTCDSACACGLPCAPDLSTLSPADGPPLLLVASSWSLGSTLPDGTASDTAWQHYGFDLDGKHFSTACGAASQHCIPRAGAKPADVIVDGPDGTDNSFGKNIVPILLGLASDAEAKASNVAESGLSLALAIGALGPAPDASKLLLAAYPVTGDTPVTDWETHTWHPGVASLVPSAPSYPVSLAGGWMTNRRLTAYSPDGLVVSFGFSGYLLELVIRRAIVTAKVAQDGSGAEDGTIAGIIRVDDLAAGVFFLGSKAWGCEGSYDGIVTQIEQAADILADGTQDPTRTCDAVSIGLGFSAKRSGLGPPGAPPSPDTWCHAKP